jgi:hypothetical protein
MKNYFKISILLLTLLLFSCNDSKPKDKENVSNSTTQQVDLFDSIDNNTYIGFVYKYYFQKTDEFYIELYSKGDNLNFEEISELADSVIYKDDENMRSRIPDNVASKEFDFSGIRDLTIFDENHNELTKAHFVRVELLDGNISSYFTAVYKAERPKVLEKAVYCIGNLNENVTKVNYTEFEDSIMTNEIVNRLNLTHNYNLESKHYHDNTTKATISVINLDTVVQIIEKSNSEYTCIYKSTENENIFDLLFVPIIRNSKPILLTKSWMPDTDAAWNSILVYDGKNYKLTEKQRIKNNTTTP